MKRVLLAVMAVLMSTGVLMAQVGAKDVLQERTIEKYAEIMTPVMDIQARSEAQFYKEDAYSYDLFKRGFYTGGAYNGSAYEKELRALIEKYMNSSDPIVVTEDEKEQLESRRREFDRFRSNQRTAQMRTYKEQDVMNRKIREIEEPLFELEARYWAYRIAHVKDITFDELNQYSYDWVGEYQYNKKLMAKVKENLETGNTAKLSRREEKKLEKAKKRIVKLLTSQK